MSVCLDGSGNCLGEDGCEALREVMEEMDKADALGSLRYPGLWTVALATLVAKGHIVCGSKGFTPNLLAFPQ